MGSGLWWLRAGGDDWGVLFADGAIAKSFPRSPVSQASEAVYFALCPQALDSAPRPRSAMLDAPGLQETDCDGLLGQSRMKPAEPTLAAMQGVSACSKALEAPDSHATRQ